MNMEEYMAMLHAMAKDDKPKSVPPSEDSADLA